MKASRAATLEEYRLENSYLQLKNQILQDAKLRVCMDKPIAFWALPADRRLPFALLRDSLKEILDRDFAELAATAGVGVKKIGSLLVLLQRATEGLDPRLEQAIPKPTTAPKPKAAKPQDAARAAADFDPTQVSEAVWQTWQTTVKRHQVGYLKLGRVAHSLANLPTVVWQVPLSQFQDMSLDSIRQLKTFGEKRVRVVMESFFTLHTLLQGVEPSSTLVVGFIPRFAARLTNWLEQVNASETLPNAETVQTEFSGVVAQQFRHDLGKVVGDLVDGRLALGREVESVRRQSEKRGVTRARIYQHFDDCARAAAVRWPEGRILIKQVQPRFEALPKRNQVRELFLKTAELLYPAKFDSNFDSTSQEVD